MKFMLPLPVRGSTVCTFYAKIQNKKSVRSLMQDTMKKTMGNIAEKCFFCKKEVDSEGKCRRITERKFDKLKVSAVDLESAMGSQICLLCWMSKTVCTLEKKCSVENCTSTLKNSFAGYTTSR